MTMTSARPAAPDASIPIAWASVQAGVWVGKKNGDFAGMIEATGADGFIATTGLAEPIGEFNSLAAAKASFAG